MNPGTSRSPDPADLLRTALGATEQPVPWTAPSIADLAQAFPELTLHELIGQGGMAAVYRATQTRLGRSVALKVMRGDLASQPQFVDRFVREARALAALGNPHVLTIHDFGERAGYCYLVTEFVDGANLRELMQLGRLQPSEVLRIVPQICAGLHFAHQHGVVHRDIKPENVLVDRQGLVKLVDFGLAKLAGDPGRPQLTGSGVVFGTPHYMAPEQWHGSATVDHRADIYSLGVVLYELLTGRLPVGTYAPASQEPGVPSGIDQVVQRSLQQEPERRYQSARDVQRDLEHQGQELPAARAAADASTSARGAQTTVPSTTGTPGPSATGQLVAAVLVLLAGTAAWIAFLANQSFIEATQWFLQSQAAHTRQAMRELQAMVAEGKAWTGRVPEALEPLSQGLLPDLSKGALAGVWATAVVVLVLLLAAAARRRTCHADASRSQFVFARLLLWLPAIAPIMALLAWFTSRYAEASNGVVPFLVMLTGFFGLFFTVRALWIASASRPIGAPLPPSPSMRFGMAACVLALLGCIAGFVWAPRQTPLHIVVPVPVAAHQLLGLTRAQVLDRLGPPRAITASPNSMAWTYRALDGEDNGAAIEFTNGIVTGADDDGPLLVPEPVPENGAFAGQSVQELLTALGPARNSTRSTSGTELEFADGTRVSVSLEGVVVAVRR